MNVIILLIGCSLILAVCFLVAFIWSVRNGQMDDSYTPAIRILLDDDVPSEEEQSADSK